MLVEVRPPSRDQVTYLTSAAFALQQDGWNDFSFQTLYHLYYRKPDEEIVYIGPVKILKRGQTKRDGILILESFESLGEDFISVGNNLDYYKRLNEIPRSDRDAILQALTDATVHEDRIPSFANEDGWGTSVFRSNSSWQDYLRDARTLVEGDYLALADMEQSFSYRPPGSESLIVFDFKAPRPHTYLGPYGLSGNRNVLPERVIVLIGRNGSGKSTLLSRLAHLAFASPQERESQRLQSFGSLVPSSIGFMRVITISYSAFDSFAVPGDDARDLDQTAKDIATGESRFVFCGLRDIVAELHLDISESEFSPGDVLERRGSTRLKSLDILAKEFSDLIVRIALMERTDIWASALKTLASDPSFSEHANDLNELPYEPDSPEKIFLGWSTGHKVVLHVIAQLVAHARPRSLILFDEPETHLHPPLIAALMHAVRLVLAATNAFCVVATHSPVLLQETLARHIRIVDRVGNAVTIKTPKLETFGESLGILTYDAFSLTSSSTDFHRILETLVDLCRTPEEVERLFTPGLSGQARAYVLSRFAEKG